MSAKAWAKRFDIKPFITRCYRCGATAITNIPFADGPLRGLVAPDCKCGHPTPPYCVVSLKGNDVKDLFPESSRNDE